MVSNLERENTHQPEIIKEFWSFPLKMQLEEGKGLGKLMRYRKTKKLRSIYLKTIRELPGADYVLEKDTADYAIEIYGDEKGKDGYTRSVNHSFRLATIAGGTAVGRAGTLIHDAEEEGRADRNTIIQRLHIERGHRLELAEAIAQKVHILNHKADAFSGKPEEEAKRTFYQQLRDTDARYPELGLIRSKYLDTIDNIARDLVIILVLSKKRYKRKGKEKLRRERIGQAQERLANYVSNKAEKLYEEFSDYDPILARKLNEAIMLAKQYIPDSTTIYQAYK